MKVKTKKAWEKFLKRLKVSWRGILFVMRRPKYIILTVAVALLFAIILTMTSSGTTDWQLLFSSISAGDKFGILGTVFLRVFTNLLTFDGWLILLLSICQGVAIALLVFNFREQHHVDDKSLLRSSVASVIAIVGAGCPMCGTSLLIPLLTTIFSTSAYVIFDSISNFVMLIAFALMLFALRRLGFVSFTVMNSKKVRKEKNDQR
jgi:hypothetical protein